MTQARILKTSRLESLTDGVFAIAMTILVLNLSLPTDHAISDISSFLISSILLKLCVYIGSFIILGTLWIAMHFQMGLLDHTNRPYLWTHIFYLMIICIVPFSANLIAAYPNNSIALSFYALNLLCASMTQLVIFEFSHIYRLNDERYNPALRSAVIRRIFVAPIFYVLALIVAQWNTKLGFLILIFPTLIYMLPGAIDKFDQGNH